MKLVVLFAVLASFLFSKELNIVVSILPQQTFVKKIVQDMANVTVMVKPGNSPHTYEPKASQMKDISKADIYFTIGVEFENVWMKRFSNQNQDMKIIDISKGIEKQEIGGHHHEGEKEDEHKEHVLDPHIWTSTQNVEKIAKNIYEALVKYDNKNKEQYNKNYESFLNEIKQTRGTIKDIFKDTKEETKFMVFHPSWGYFAKEFNLEQLAIEVGGKNPKPKMVRTIIDEAREENVNVIFTAPEFSDKIAKQIASELNIKVIAVSPLNPKWSQNLINLAKAIAKK